MKTMDKNEVGPLANFAGISERGGKENGKTAEHSNALRRGEKSC